MLAVIVVALCVCVLVVWVNSVVLSFAFICVLCCVLLPLSCMVVGGIVCLLG